MTWPRYPSVLEINTWVWLSDLTKKLGVPVDLSSVPPYQTLLIADALIKANKDFDLLLLPNQNHGYGTASNYMIRRRWDFFVRWLIDAEPPREYLIK